MPRQPRRATRSALGVLTLAVLSVTAGCGGDEPDAVGPSDDASTSASPSASPSGSGSASPTDDTSASSGTALPGDTYADTEPATGPTFSHDGMSINPPADWTAPGEGETLVGPTPDDVIQLTRSTASGQPPAEQVQDALDLFGFAPDSQVLPEVTILGQPAYHISGTDEVFGNLVDQFGLSTPQGDFRIRIATAQDLPQAERDQLIASSMATLEIDGLS